MSEWSTITPFLLFVFLLLTFPGLFIIDTTTLMKNSLGKWLILGTSFSNVVSSECWWWIVYP